MAGHSSTFPVSALADETPDSKISQAEVMPGHVEGLAIEMDPSEGCDEICGLCGSLNIEALLSDYEPPGGWFDGFEIDILPAEPRDCLASYQRSTNRIQPTTPVTEITIV